MEIKKKYIQLKEKAKKALLEGEMKLYIQLLNDLENFNLILVSTQKGKR
jgi:hypothetical protein